MNRVLTNGRYGRRSDYGIWNEQIFKKLQAGNLVISQRGPGGGYSPRGDDITVTEVITAVSKLPAHKTFEPILRALDDVRVSQLLRGDSPAP